VRITLLRTAQVAVVGFAAVAATVAFGGTAQAQTADTATAAASGDRGDPVTNGRSVSFDTARGDWFNLLATPHVGDLGVHVESADGEQWSFVFAAPDGRTLEPGTYRAVDYASHGDRPGLSVFTNDRACTTSTGRFTVLAASFRNGYVERFDATFEQRCEGRRAAARGEVHIANQPLPTMAARTTSGTVDAAGAAHPSGAVTCSEPMEVAVLGTVTQQVRGARVTGEFTVWVDCTPDRAATWTATVPAGQGLSFKRGKASVDLQAYHYVSWADVTIDASSHDTVRLARA
jgi:hypothetical protein